MTDATVDLKNILIKGGYVDSAAYGEAEAHAAVHATTPEVYLLSHGLLTENLLGQAMAEFFSVPFADLPSHPPSIEHIQAIPETEAKKYRVVLYKAKDDELTIATDNPAQAGLAAALAQLFLNDKLPAFKLLGGKKIALAYARPRDIEACFLHYRKPLAARFAEIFSSNKYSASAVFQELIEDAATVNASDIHFDARKKETVVRFRIDGILHEAGRIPHLAYESILNYMKVQANLRIDEHFSSQDGAIRYERSSKEPIDLRISVVPTVGGEKVTLRLLAQYVNSLGLTEIGLSPDQQSVIEVAVHKPYGMILIAGPTGSGKTTSLYALLRQVNTPEVNIATIEDPVEYILEEANQIQVNPKTNLTFASGLRSIVRQDPNIILVGEIRDNETADIAVNAALTGHLLLTSFHANNAATVVPRLIDMGVEPFLLASTLELIISQRLVRRVCPTCRYSYQTSLSELKKTIPDAERYFTEETVRLYKGLGCPACKNIGYRGRVALFEIIHITSPLAALFLQNPSAEAIWKTAVAEGARSLYDDGMNKAIAGLTTVEEVGRVAAQLR